MNDGVARQFLCAKEHDDDDDTSGSLEVSTGECF